MNLDMIRRENAQRRRLKEEAAPAPWVFWGPTEHAGMCYVNSSGGSRVAFMGNLAKAAANAAFVAAARNDDVEKTVDLLAAEVERLRKIATGQME